MTSGVLLLESWRSFGVQSETHQEKLFCLSLNLFFPPQAFSILDQIISLIHRGIAHHMDFFSRKKVGKQELYSVKENFEIRSKEIFAREKWRQNNAGLHQGVIVSLVISCVGRPFWICLPVGEILSYNVPCSSLFIVQFLFLPSTCGVSLKERVQKPPVNAEFLEFVSKRRSTNRSWRPSCTYMWSA